MKLHMIRLLSLLGIVLCFSQSALADKGVHQKDLQNVVGAWMGDVTISDPQGMDGFATMLTFHEGGTMSETHPLFSVDKAGLGNLMATPGHGVWAKVGPGYYKVSFKLFIQGGPGNPDHEGQLIGTNHINYFVMISENGQNMKAKWSSKLISTDGIEIIGGSGTFIGHRINVAPLP